MPAVEHVRLPFAEAIEFFRGKLGNLIPTAKWDDVKKAQHDRGFMVAGAMKADLLNDFATAVQTTIEDGKSIDWFRKAFDAIVDAHGWAHTGERNWRSRVIYQTNLTTSYAAGRLAQLRDPELLDLKPYWTYRHNDSVLNPRPEHQAWDGLTLPADDPWWQTHYPPNGWGCFPGDTCVQGKFEVGLKAFYAGKMVELHTGRGYRVALTVNHPVLTARGWVRADEVAEGDTVFCQSGDVGHACTVEKNKQDAVPTAEQVFNTLAAQGLREECILPNDFDGDGRFMQRDIHVVGADGFLAGQREAAAGERIAELPGNRARVLERIPLARDGDLGESLDGAAPAFHVDAQTCGIMPPAREPFLADSPLHRPTRNAQLARDRFAAESAPIQRDDLSTQRGERVAFTALAPRAGKKPLGLRAVAADRLPAQTLRAGVSSQIDAALAEYPGERTTADAEIARDALQRLALAVAPDCVMRIRKFDFCGHVFDFQTSDHLIVTNGVVVHNCQCYTVAVTREEAERKGYRVEAPPPDVIDPRTGAPRGIDRGWGYMPGDTRSDDIRATLQAKAAQLPGPLGDALRNDLDRP